jgi:hypothetical protein
MDCEFPLHRVCDKLSAPNFRLGATGWVDCVLPIKLQYFKRWYAILRWVSGWVGVKLKISRKVYHIPTHGKFTIVMWLWVGGRPTGPMTASRATYSCGWCGMPRLPCPSPSCRKLGRTCRCGSLHRQSRHSSRCAIATMSLFPVRALSSPCFSMLGL